MMSIYLSGCEAPAAGEKKIWPFLMGLQLSNSFQTLHAHGLSNLKHLFVKCEKVSK